MQCIIIQGCLKDGFIFIGPFEGKQEAMKGVENLGILEMDWELASLQPASTIEPEVEADVEPEAETGDPPRTKEWIVVFDFAETMDEPSKEEKHRFILPQPYNQNDDQDDEVFDLLVEMARKQGLDTDFIEDHYPAYMEDEADAQRNGYLSRNEAEAEALHNG